MSTKDRYKEAGLRAPKHAKRVSPDTHHIRPELQPVDVVAEPKPKRSRGTSRSSSTTNRQEA